MLFSLSVLKGPNGEQLCGRVVAVCAVSVKADTFSHSSTSVMHVC